MLLAAEAQRSLALNDHTMPILLFDEAHRLDTATGDLVEMLGPAGLGVSGPPVPAVLAFSRPDERVDYWIRMSRDPAAYAQKLYAALRELDAAACEVILVEGPPEAPEWLAVRDRLQRACA